mgnify:CR=1 FL=1
MAADQHTKGDQNLPTKCYRLALIESPAAKAKQSNPSVGNDAAGQEDDSAHQDQTGPVKHLVRMKCYIGEPKAGGGGRQTFVDISGKTCIGSEMGRVAFGYGHTLGVIAHPVRSANASPSRPW